MIPHDLVSRAKTSLQLANLILAQIDDVVYVVDQHYRLAFLNNTLALSPSRNILGKRCYETIMENSHPCDFCPLPAIISGQQPRISQVITRGQRQ
jgi:hypothetical protein